MLVVMVESRCGKGVWENGGEIDGVPHKKLPTRLIVNN
jgi:hypothetical protein